MGKKFSIITSSYNSATFLTDWAVSILEQSYRPLEVVFVDDCSTDDTNRVLPKILNRLEKSGIEVKHIRNNKRLFCGSSYKIAWKNATGDYFGVLDSDDMLKRESVKYIVGMYEKYPKALYIYTKYDSYDKRMKKLKGRCISRPPLPGESLLSMGKRRKHAFSHWRTFANRSPRLHKIWKKGLRCAVDKYMGYRLEELGPGIFTKKSCYKYREPSSKRISMTEKTRETWKNIVKEASFRRKQYKLKPYPIMVVRK